MGHRELEVYRWGHKDLRRVGGETGTGSRWDRQRELGGGGGPQGGRRTMYR